MRIAIALLGIVFWLAPAFGGEQPPPVTHWTQELKVDDKGAIPKGSYVNWYPGRLPMCSFLGGIVFGQREPKDLWFFYDKPFRFYTGGFDNMLAGDGDVFGIRILFCRYKEGKTPQAFRSFFFDISGATLDKNHPSYILVNGRRMWDATRNKIAPASSGGQARITMPCWVEEAEDVVVDLVVDRKLTPDVKALGFRYCFLNYLGDPGQKIFLDGAQSTKEPSPMDTQHTMRFGLFGPGYPNFPDDKTPTYDQLGWEKYKAPDYPLSDIAVAPNHFGGGDNYNTVVSTWLGANLVGPAAKPELIKGLGARFHGFGLGEDAAKTKALLESYPNALCYWFVETGGDRHDYVKAKQATGKPENVRVVEEPFPPSIAGAVQACENGADIVLLKNQELPQHNMLFAAARGASRSCNVPWAFGCFTVHTPFPSLDFREQYFLLAYFSGTRYICSETDGLDDLRLSEFSRPYARALRFYGYHPERGESVERIGILWSKGDTWKIPFTPFGCYDTYLKYVGYDSSTNRITCTPVAEMEPKAGLWESPWWLKPIMEGEKKGLEYKHGYDLLDVFLPQYGDCLTTHFARMLTGTPCGPLDFLCLDKVSADTLKPYRLLACLGHAALTPAAQQNLEQAINGGAAFVGAVSHVKPVKGAFGITLAGAPAPCKGKLKGRPEIYGAELDLEAKVYKAEGEGLEPVAWFADTQTPLIVRKKLGAGAVYIVLTENAAEAAAGLRPLLAYLGAAVNMVSFANANDQLEYVVNRKGAGVLVTVFNHGAIPVGSDRVYQQRAEPPEPLVSKITGPWTGTVLFHLDGIGLPPNTEYEIAAVDGVDGDAYEGVVAGRRGFAVKALDSRNTDNGVEVRATIGKRAEFVIAPKGQSQALFFGK